MEQKKKSQKQKTPNIANQIIIAIFIFISITIVYSFVAQSPKDIKHMTISDVARNVISGEIEKLEIVGQDINITFKDKVQGTS